MTRIRSTNVKTILKGALAKIQRGWMRCDMYQPGRVPKYCSLGAINSCTPTGIYGSHPAAENAYLAFKAANKITTGIIAWNDKPGRKQSEVVAAFKKAIKSVK